MVRGSGYADLLHGSAGGVWFCMAFPLFIVAVACWPVVALLGAALAIVGGFMVGFFVGFAPVQKGCVAARCLRCARPAALASAR